VDAESQREVDRDDTVRPTGRLTDHHDAAQQLHALVGKVQVEQLVR
jgi:hypothetical protein